MSPFDQNIDNDAGHSIDQDDLIAFHLHELSSPQERALHRVLQTNPALQSESLAIATTLRAFSKYEAPLPLDTAALDRHWQALRPTLTPYVPPTIVPRSLFPRSVFHRWALPALAGSVLATTALVVALHHDRHTAPITVATTQTPTSTTPSIPPVAPSNTAPSFGPTLTASTQRPWLNNNQLDNQINNPSSFPPAAPPQTALTKPSTSPLPTEPLAPTSPTQVSPATTTNTTTATTESLASQSTSTTSATSPSLTQLSKLRPPTIHHPHTTDLTLAVLGNLTPARSFTATQGTGPNAVIASLTQSTTPAIGVLASLHQQFRPWLGYRAAASYSQPTFEYTYSLAAGSSSGNIVDENAYELSGTYVVEGLRHRRISTAAEAGAGLLALLPASPNRSTVPVGNAYRPAAVFGASAEFTLTRHLALHAGYRALLYKGPSAALTYGSIVPTTPGNLTFSSEPLIGLTYRFHEANE